MRYFCFDVESPGLYAGNNPLQVAALVYDEQFGDFTIVDGLIATRPLKEDDKMSMDTRDWVENHLHSDDEIKDFLDRRKIHVPNQHYALTDAKDVRKVFWDFYMKYRESCAIVGDCIYPVETSFMQQCIFDENQRRGNNNDYIVDDVMFLGPYPWIDVNSMSRDRNDYGGVSECDHNPIYDVMTSMEKFQGIKRR